MTSKGPFQPKAFYHSKSDPTLKLALLFSLNDPVYHLDSRVVIIQRLNASWTDGVKNLIFPLLYQ